MDKLSMDKLSVHKLSMDKLSVDKFPMDRFLTELEQVVNMDSGTDYVEGCCQVADFFAARLTAAGLHTTVTPCGEEQRPFITAVTSSVTPAVVTSAVAPAINSAATSAATPAADSAVNSAATPAAKSSVTPAAVTPANSAAIQAVAPEKPYDFLLVGHLDTVFPAGTAARRPFSLDREAGRAYGPGTVDMKAGALLMVYIAEYMAKHHPEISLCLALNSDEETGSESSAQLLTQLGLQARCAFVFEGARKQGQFVHQRKGCSKYQIEIKGIASHAGTAPKLGASAIVEAAHLIVELDKLKRYDRGTSVNTGLVSGGTAVNVVADSCSATVEVRYTDEKEMARIERAIGKLQSKPYVSGTSIEITRISSELPLTITPQTESLMEQMQAYATASLSCGAVSSPVAFVSAGGLSDANRLAHCQIPVIDGCGPGGGFPHSEKEFLSIKTVESRFRFMTGLLPYLFSGLL